jgi:lipopolysaccharide export system permease protein
MNTLDLYILNRVFKITTLVTIVFMGLVWLTQSLRFIDVIVNHNVSFLGYLKLVSFLLPDLFTNILPICFLIAVIHVLNKLSRENELVAMGSLGMGDFDLYRPIGLISVILVTLILAINFFIVPGSFKKFRDAEYNLKNEISSVIIRGGQFNFFKDTGVYVEEQDKSGVMKNIFIHKKNSESEHVIIGEKSTVEARQGQLYLVIKNGVKYEKKNSGDKSQLYFEDLTYDLTPLFRENNPRSQKPYEKNISELIFPEDELPEHTKGKMKAEGHQRILNPLLTIVDGLLATIFLARDMGKRKRFRKRYVFMIAIALLVHGGIVSLINMSISKGPYISFTYGLVISLIVGGLTVLISEKAKRSLRISA